jgi:cardiolipin synthase A/B
MSSLPFVYEICDWILRLTMLVIVTRRRRHANAAMAWLLVIFLEPWLGSLLFFMIGNHRLPRSRVERTRQLMSKADWFLDRFRNHPRVVTPRITAHQDETVRLAQRLGKLPILGGNGVGMMSDTNDFIQKLVEDIDGAKNHVHLLFYIFGNDEVGHEVAGALHRAVQRGVVCRVLADSVGSKVMLNSLAKEMKRGGVQVARRLRGWISAIIARSRSLTDEPATPARKTS